MLKLRPLLASLLAAGLLQGCASAPPQAQAPAQPAAAHARGAATYYRLGKQLQERGELELAMAAYTMSIELDKRQLEARNAAAALHARQGRLDQAAALLRQLVADFPAQAHPHNNLGYVYYMQGNYAGAAAALRRALLLDGQNELARNNLTLAETALADAAAAPAVPTAPAMATVMPAVTEMPTVVVMPAPPAAAIAAPAPPAPAAPGRVELVQLEPNVYQLKFNKVGVPPPASLPVPALPAADRLSKAPAAQPARLEIASGNGVAGMAKRIRQVLAQLGIPVRRLSNERPYTRRSTTIQYRPGYEREAAVLQRALKGEVALLASTGLSSDADLRLVLGKDGAEQLARAEAAAGFPLLAINDAAP